MSEPHHALTHHRGMTESIEKVSKINRFHVEQFTYFIGKLKAAREADGTLLDRTMIVYASAIADGNAPSHDNLPVLPAGRGGGWKAGRHLVYRKGTPMTNLYMAMLDKMGVHPEVIGDSNGLTEL